MAGKSYVGQNTRFYEVMDRPDGSIELRVYHENSGVRKLLQAHLTESSYFLGRHEAFHRSQTRAANGRFRTVEGRNRAGGRMARNCFTCHRKAS